VKLREALIRQAPSLALQRAAADEIARLDSLLAQSQHGETMTAEIPRAVEAPLSASARPTVWMVRLQCAPDYWIPFLHEPVDALKDPGREVVRMHWAEDIAAVAAEREACAKVCEE
jgi:hypothetical protein